MSVHDASDSAAQHERHRPGPAVPSGDTFANGATSWIERTTPKVERVVRAHPCLSSREEDRRLPRRLSPRSLIARLSVTVSPLPGCTEFGHCCRDAKAIRHEQWSQRYSLGPNHKEVAMSNES